MITYIIISFLMMVTPGPGVLSLAGVGAGFGWKVGMMYLIGLFFGTNGVALLVVLGFKQFLFEIDGVEITFLLLSLSYLSFLSWRIATSDNKTGFKQSLKAPRLYEGIFLQFINPKAWSIAVTVASGFFPTEENIFIGITFVTITAAVICFPTISLWALFGSGLRKFVTDIKIKKIIEYLLALLLVLTGLFILFK